MTGQYTYLKKVQVRVQNLRIGMYVSELDKPWNQSSFVFQGFPIKNETELLKIQQECDWVVVDFPSQTEYHTYLETIEGGGKRKAKNPQARIPQEALDAELITASKQIHNSTQMVKNVMEKIIKEEEFELAPVANAVEECVNSILHNPDALMLLTNIKNADEYTAEHCMRVAIMAIAFAKHLGMSRDELECIGIGAMLHDVGKMRVPDEILNKPGKLTREEYEIMKRHAAEGFNILKEKKQLSAGVIDIAHSHHERLDGEGYPRKLLDHQISRYARLVTIVDTFDAITSERVYSGAESPSKAFKVLVDHAGSQFDAKLAKKFVEWMGVYPLGSIVEMRTGEIGIVTKVHQKKKLKPRVLLVTDENKESGVEKIVDLARMDVHSSGEPYLIKTVHPNGAFDVKLNDYLSKGLRIAH